MKTYIAYLRQSTMKQQISGLGVEAQREIIHSHVKNKPILAEYIETESGKKSNRPQLLAASLTCLVISISCLLGFKLPLG